MAARLVFINQPYVDHWSWRQSDVAAIARNFFENGFRFAYPQIDWAGNATGYVGTEFPILPFIAAICYKLAGIHEWIGRIQAVIFFAISLPLFFLLVREIFGGTAALWATFFFSFAPVNIFAGRSFMPDGPSLSLAIIGLYFFLRWIESEHRRDACAAGGFATRRTCGGENLRWPRRLQAYAPLLASAVAISLSLLIKITSSIIFAPVAYIVVWRLCQTPVVSQNAAGGSRATWKGTFLDGANGRERVKRPTIYGEIALFLAIALLPSAVWYWHAHQIAERFYPHHFFGAGGIRIENFSWYCAIARQTAISSLTPILSIMALIGLFVPQSRDQRYSRLFHWWLAAMLLFVIVAGYGNRHRWYQLPLVPVTAAFAGVACAQVHRLLRRRSTRSDNAFHLILSILLAGSFALPAYFYVRPLYEASAAQLRDAGLELNRITAPDALIVAADTGDPAIFYYAQRKGWHFLEEDAIYAGNPSDSQEAIADLEDLRRRGATHLVFTTNTFWWLDYYPEFVQHLSKNARLVDATSEFKVYELNAVSR